MHRYEGCKARHRCVHGRLRGTCTTPKFAKPNRRGCDRYKVIEGFSWKGRVAGWIINQPQLSALFFCLLRPWPNYGIEEAFPSLNYIWPLSYPFSRNTFLSSSISRREFVHDTTVLPVYRENSKREFTIQDLLSDIIHDKSTNRFIPFVDYQTITLKRNIILIPKSLRDRETFFPRNNPAFSNPTYSTSPRKRLTKLSKYVRAHRVIFLLHDRSCIKPQLISREMRFVRRFGVEAWHPFSPASRYGLHG